MDIVKQENQISTPSQLLELAIKSNVDIDKLKELMALQKEWKADRAREEFFGALTQFQSLCPELRKSKKVSFKTNSGQVEYHYATLADITRQIKSALKETGIAYRWEIADSADEIKVKCLITHSSGHTESTTMMAKPDASGSKNPIQARGSTIEYLKRYTLIGALGISTSDSDIDGSLPEVDVDKLHKQYMEFYDQLIQKDPGKSKWHPDNWKSDRTAKTYVKAISEIRKELGNV